MTSTAASLALLCSQVRPMDIDKNDLKRIMTAAMLLLLVATAPKWLGPQGPHTSGYDAPWVYPALLPAQH